MTVNNKLNMFESILERILQKALGEYIEGLDRNNLKLGVWSGYINLENVQVKRTLFQKFKLPLTLRLGRIGRLSIKVPWRSLSSSPVVIEIEGANLLICPKGKEEWEMIETLHTNIDMREQFIKDFAVQLFQTLIKTQDDEQEQQGFMKNLATKILDNVQLTISNLHMRLENFEHFGSQFALGLTLKEISVHTTNGQWQKEYFDRTISQNQDKPIYKVLNIVKFGVYWITNCDEFFARDFPGEEQEDMRLKSMKLLFGRNQDYIEKYREQYLLQPIQLAMKLKQVTDALQMTTEAEFQVSMDIDEFSIFLQKTQYDNIAHLMELFNDYSKYQQSYQMTRKYKFLRPRIPPTQAHYGLQMFIYAVHCVKLELRQQKTYMNLFQVPIIQQMEHQKAYKSAFTTIIAEQIKQVLEGQESQIFEKVLTKLPYCYLSEDQREFCTFIVMAEEAETLKLWADSVCRDIAQVFKEERAQYLALLETQGKQSYLAMGGSMVSSVFGGFTWLRGSSSQQADSEKLEEPDEEEEEKQPVADTQTVEMNQGDSDDEFFDAYDDQEQAKNHPQQKQSTLDRDLNSLEAMLIENFSATAKHQHLIPQGETSRITEGSSLMSKLQGGALTMKDRTKSEVNAVPAVRATFSLKSFSIALVNNQRQSEGLEIFSKEFTIDFNKFDDDTEETPHSISLVAKVKEFGVNQLIQIESQMYRTPIIMRESLNKRSFNVSMFLQQQSMQDYQGVIIVKKGNPLARTKGSQIQKDYYDLDLQVSFQPLRIIYQVVPINQLITFLKVENFKEELRQQAMQRLETLKQSVNITDVLKTKQKNRLRFDIASPILVIPFMMNNDINTECWIFNMGNIQVQNYVEEFGPSLEHLSLKPYKNFKVEISQIMMMYAKSYKLWLEDSSEKGSVVSEVIKEFRLQFILSMLKAKNKQHADMKFLEDVSKTRVLKSDFILQGSMSDLRVSFTPHIYKNIVNIDKLLTMDEKSSKQTFQHQLLHDKTQVVKLASKIGQLSVDSTPLAPARGPQQDPLKFAVLSGPYLYFYQTSQAQHPDSYFYLKTCSIEDREDSDLTVKLSNRQDQNVQLGFANSRVAQEWKQAIESKARELDEEIREKVESRKDEEESKHQDIFAQNMERQAPVQELPQPKPEDVKESQMEFHFVMELISVEVRVDNDPDQVDIGVFQRYMGPNKDEQSSPFREFEELYGEEVVWRTEMELRNISIKHFKRTKDMDLTVKLQSLNIRDNKNTRFPDLIQSRLGPDKDELIIINMLKKDRRAANYQGIDMAVDLKFGIIEVYWHPKTLNRLIRFFRYMKLETLVVEQEKEKFFHELKKNSMRKADQNSAMGEESVRSKKKGEIDISEDVPDNCVSHPEKFMQVCMKLERLDITLIHPINFTYPIATMSLQQFGMLYSQHYDHDHYQGSIGNLQMFDNTNYPMTIDPNKLYSSACKLPKYELFGQRQDQLAGFSKLLEFESVMFAKPLANECPHQRDLFDKNVDLKLSGIRFQFMMEWVFRLNDYFFNQLLGALADANPYQKLIDQTWDSLRAQYGSKYQRGQSLAESLNRNDNSLINSVNNQEIGDQPLLRHSVSQMPKAQDPLSESKHSESLHHSHHHPRHGHPHHSQHHASEKSIFTTLSQNMKKVYQQWYELDLNQQKSCVGLNLTIERPLIVLKDRPYLQNKLEIDLGNIKIKSKTEEVEGRWKHLEAKKVWVTKFLIKMNDMSIKQNNEFEVASPFNMQVTFEKLNYSPLLQDSYSSQGLDFLELDISNHISLSLSPLIMHLKQDIYTYLLRCNDLNIGYSDQLNPYFQLSIWNNGEDTQKYLKQEEQIVKKYQNKSVYKMKVAMNFQSLALQLHNKANAFLAELIFQNVDFEFLKYVDYRKDISLKSYSFYILHRPPGSITERNLKSVAIAPVNSKNLICTDSEFYSLRQGSRDLSNKQGGNPGSPNKRNNKVTAEQTYAKRNFIVEVHMEADGSKLLQVRIEKLKIFVKPHIFMTIQEIFMNGMPQYKDEKDKPNYYDSDWGNAAKMEVGCQILQSLVCFENEGNLQKTIACQGNTSFTMIREKMNSIKAKLLEVPMNFYKQQQEMEGIRKQTGTSFSLATIDTSSTYKLMQVSISDLCPFFCLQTDLDGKKFNQVRKREMMSPFTLFFNKSDIIELSKVNERWYALSPDCLIFKMYNKIEANLERTLLKISFNDIKILKGISDHLGLMMTQEYERLIKDTSTDGKQNSALGHGGKLQTQETRDRGTSQKSSTPNTEFGLRLNLARCEKDGMQMPSKESRQPRGDSEDSEVYEDEDYRLLGKRELENVGEDSIKTDSELEDDQMNDMEQKQHEERVQELRNKANLQRGHTIIGGSKSNKQMRHLDNFTESVRRTSIAFSLFQNFGKKLQNATLNASFDEDMLKQYEQVFSNHKLLASLQKKSPSYEASPEDPRSIREEYDAEENEDFEEGNRISMLNQGSLNMILKTESPQATKRKDMNQYTIVPDQQDLGVKIDIKSIKEEQGENDFQVVSYGLKVLIINDAQQNFFPVIGISLSEFHYSLGMNDSQKAGSTQFSSAVSYYNPEAGEWEPFIETFTVHFTISETFATKNKIYFCSLPNSLNVNLTPKLVQNIYSTYNSWLRSLSLESDKDLSLNQASKVKAPEPQIPYQRHLDEDFDDETSLREEDDESYSRGGGISQGDLGGTGRGRKTQKRSMLGGDLSQASKRQEEEDEGNVIEEEDVVTPYSICNQTNSLLLVKRLNQSEMRGKQSKRIQGNSQKKNDLNNLQMKGGDVDSSHILDQSKLNRVYKIYPNQTIDYAVDYELQVKQQISMYNSHQFSGQQGEFIKVHFDDSDSQNSSMKGKLPSTPVGMTIPLNHVNLNQVGCKKHFLRDDDRHQASEFYVYGVSQVNMKKVLTVRTQYLFVNQTFQSYEVHIRFPRSSIVKNLAPGDRLPIPDSYNQCKFQFRISPNQGEEEDDALSSSFNQTMTNRTSKIINTSINTSMVQAKSLKDIMRNGRDISDFQAVCRSWSDMLVVNALKTKLPVSKTTFLKHGANFTIIKKEASDFLEAYDIVLRPPLLLKNCLPVPIHLAYDEDSNGNRGEFNLEKQEERHIVEFNLRQQVMLRMTIQGFHETMIIIDSQTEKEQEIKATIYDKNGRELDIYVAISNKVAGKKALFYVKSLLINHTEQNLDFYYSEPNQKQIGKKTFKEGVAGEPMSFSSSHMDSKKTQCFMLSDKQHIFGSLEGSTSVSNPINIFNPGCKDKFFLIREKMVYEFAYQTEIFLASKDEYAYTKITTLTPLYVVVNKTSRDLLIAQVGSETQSLTVQQNQRLPFHWSDLSKENRACIKLSSRHRGGVGPSDLVILQDREENFEYEWTSGFSVAEVGQITLQMRSLREGPENIIKVATEKATKRVKNIKIDRRLQKNTVFIIVEEEKEAQSTYRVENFSTRFDVSLWQKNMHDRGLNYVKKDSKIAFAWADYYQDLEVQLNIYSGDPMTQSFKKVCEPERTYKLDSLNERDEIKIPLSDLDTTSLFVYTFTNGYTKILRFSDHDTENLGELVSGTDEEAQLPTQKIDFQLQQFTLSMISPGSELMVIYLRGIKGSFDDQEVDRTIAFHLDFFQIDNQSEHDPLFPVLLKPKLLMPSDTLRGASEDTDQIQRQSSLQRTKGKHVFNLKVHLRKGISNVTYFELIQYSLESIQIKLELSHIMKVSRYLSIIGETLDQKLTWMHQIFENEETTTIESDEKMMSSVHGSQQDDEPQNVYFASSRISQTPSSRVIEEEEKQTMTPPSFTKKRHNTGQLNQPLKASERASQRQTPMAENQASKPSAFEINQQSSPKRQTSLKKQQTLAKKIRGAPSSMLYVQGGQTHQEDVRVHKDDWKEDEFQIASNRIYIKKYEASKIELEISLINRVSLSQEEEESDILKTISSLGLLISNFDEAPININAIEAENIFGDQTDVINQIKKYHTEKLLSNVLKFIGASNLLGNPVSFLNSLGTGIREFSDQTSQGEIIRGASSLVQNTLAGTMNSASKITSSFSKGLLVLSDDKEYIYQRDVDTIKNKPKNMFQGINLGLKSAFNSVGSGIAGIVQKPIEETKKDGFYGFLKGTVKGVTGLVVKPMSGALDLISLTSEGIKNTTKTDYELLSDKRLRLPRPFYEIERTIREYDDFHAFWLNLVPRLQPSISPDLFYEASLLESHDDSLALLFLTHTQIALIHQLQKTPKLRDRPSGDPRQQKSPFSVKWVYTTTQIKYIDIIDEKKLSIGFKETCVNLAIGDANIAERIRVKVEKIIKSQSNA